MTLLIIGLAGFFTLLFKKDYSVKNNILSNANWYATVTDNK